jgi:hypothetical protein
MRIVRDHLWKIAFRLHIRQFVEFFFPYHADEVDWDKGIEFLDKELNTIQSKSSSQDRIADVLVRLFLKNSDPIWMLLHVEIQGYTDNIFAKRVHQMGYRIEDLFDITPVMLCILTDDDPNFHPKKYVSGAWGASHSTKFVAYKVMKNPPQRYLNPNSVVAVIMEVAYQATKAKKQDDKTIINQNITIVRKLLAKGYTKVDIHFLKNFISQYVKFDNQENYRIFVWKMDDMVKYETTEDILASYFDPEKRLKFYEDAYRQETQELREYYANFHKEFLANVKTEVEAIANAKVEAIANSKAEAIANAKAEAIAIANAKAEADTKLERSILFMLHQGTSFEDISRFMEISMEEIKVIQEKYKDNNPFESYLNGEA